MVENYVYTIFFPDFNQYSACSFPYILILLDYSLLFIVLTLEALIILAFFQACFGTTPGNSALGVEVLPQIYKNTFLERFDFYLKREVGVWVSGLGCGFLIISPLFVLWQALRICRRKPAFYDRYDIAIIRFKKFGVVQFILCMMLIVLILALIIAQMMEFFSIVELLKKHACYGLYN